METQIIQPLEMKEVSEQYKLKITQELLNKIEYTCTKIASLEWSGVLFYTVDGSFENKDLVLTAIDMFIQDIGSAGSTEFEITVDTGNYLVEHNLIGAQMGLIHSHNTMPTFFSGTDQSTMLKEGTDRNHFLSLIVNNAGNYTAKLSRKINYKRSTLVSYNYATYQGQVIDVTGKQEDSEETVIENFVLSIEKEQPAIPELDSIIDELYKKKEEAAKKAEELRKVSSSFYGHEDYPRYWQGTQQTLPYHNKPFEQSYLPGPKINRIEDGDEVYIDTDTPDFEEPSTWGEVIPYETVHYDKESVQTVLKKLLIATPLLEKDYSIEEFMPTMEELYKKHFKDADYFDEWASAHIEYLLWNISDPALDSQGCSAAEDMAILANDLLAELEKLPSNFYLEKYKTIVQAYIL